MYAGRLAMLRIAGCILGLSLTSGLVPAAQAQGGAWPSRPIRFIVPFPPGGPTDAYVRTVVAPLGDALGQPVVVENRAGGGGSIGAQAVARAAPDGYTMGLASAGALMALPHLMQVPYSVQNDFTYVTSIAQVPSVIAVTAKSGIANMADFLALARREPGVLNYASAGTGTLVHLVGELFKRETGVDIVHVPYSGAAPAVTNLLGGQVQSIVSDLTPLVPYVQAGTVRALAVASKQRAAVLPDVPTMTELGYPKVVHTTEYGIIMPPGTPPAIVNRVQQALARILKTDAVKATYAQMGTLAVSCTPDEYRRHVLAGYDRWGAFIKEAGITLN